MELLRLKVEKKLAITVDIVPMGNNKFVFESKKKELD